MDGWPLWQRLYNKQVSRDLEDWAAKGWVSPQNAEAIRQSLDKGESAGRLPFILSLLGTALLGLAALSFVAANWPEMPRLLRLVILFSAMAGAYAGAVLLYVRAHHTFAGAALLLGVLLFGANIMLIGQMYHLPGDYASGLFAWTVGALALAWAAKSRPVLAAGFVLALIWTGTASFDSTAPHWIYLIAWTAATVLGFRLQWTPAMHLSLLSLFGWMMVSLGGFGEWGWEPGNVLTVYLAFVFLVWLKGRIAGHLGIWAGRTTEIYAAIAFSTLFLFTQFADMGSHTPASWGAILALLLAASLALLAFAWGTRSLARTDLPGFAILFVLMGLGGLLAIGTVTAPVLIAVLGGVLYFGYAVWLIFMGTARADRFLVNLGFVAFAAEAVYIYIDTLGTLLDTALFFALGGLFLIAGSWALNRWRKRLLPNAAGAGGAA